MGNLSKNIRFLRELLGVSQGEFGSLFECTRDNIMSYERGTEPKLKTIQQIANYFHTTIDVLYNDELNSHWTIRRDDNGNVYLICIPKSIPNSKSQELGIQKVAEPTVEYQTKGGRLVTMLTQEAAASITGIVSGQQWPEEASRILLPYTLLEQNGLYFGFKVKNDSMHPTLYDGDYVISRYLEPYEWDEVKNEHIYVISTKEDGVKIKRIRNRITKSGFLRCRSDNKSVPAFNVEIQDISAIFEVKCRLSFNFPNEQAILYERLALIEDRIDDLERKKP